MGGGGGGGVGVIQHCTDVQSYTERWMDKEMLCLSSALKKTKITAPL